MRILSQVDSGQEVGVIQIDLPYEQVQVQITGWVDEKQDGTEIPVGDVEVYSITTGETLGRIARYGSADEARMACNKMRMAFAAGKTIFRFPTSQEL